MKISDKQISDVMREIGRKGWAKAGKASAKALTPEQRIERARKAGSAPKSPRKPKGALTPKQRNDAALYWQTFGGKPNAD